MLPFLGGFEHVSAGRSMSWLAPDFSARRMGGRAVCAVLLTLLPACNGFERAPCVRHVPSLYVTGLDAAPSHEPTYIGRQHSCPFIGSSRSSLQNLMASTAAANAAKFSPDWLDIMLSAAGASVGIATLTLIQHWLPLKAWSAGALQGVYVTTLCSSAIILNNGRAPPDFFSVFWATFVPAAMTVALLKLAISTAIVRPISVAITMVWFKLTGCVFPPAAALATTFLDNAKCTPMGWAYVTLPCTGNAILWAVAFVFARLRAWLRNFKSTSKQ